jgi:hypothetical protein
LAPRVTGSEPIGGAGGPPRAPSAHVSELRTSTVRDVFAGPVARAATSVPPPEGTAWSTVAVPATEGGGAIGWSSTVRLPWSMEFESLFEPVMRKP